MKILIINSYDIEGGAARAAFRLHKALLNEGIDSTMLVQRKNSDEWSIIGAKSKMEMLINRIRPTIDQIPVMFYKKRTKTLFSPAWRGNRNILKKMKEINPDIVHFHWINGGMIKIEDMTKIGKPIVWSLHDMWTFTGGCHYDEECAGYKYRCGSCKVLGSNKENDLSRKVFKRKEKTFLKVKNLTIVGLSQWLYKCLLSSPLFKDKKHIHLPNLIDTVVFKPHNKQQARELWNLPKNKKLILFGAISATSDPRKGFAKLSDALEKLSEEEMELVIFGSSAPKNPPKFKFKTHFVGHLYDDISLMTLYNAVDVMVVPSIQENFSNAIMESLSCATPVVAFDTGGNSDMIKHQKNGYLAKPFEPLDLANGIEWILNAPNYEELCKNARDKVLREFDSKIVAKKYIKLYKEILSEIN